MVKIVMQAHVADFDAWFEGFKRNESLRKEHGATGHTVNRGVDDPNVVVIATNFSTVEGAKAFLADPALKVRMAESGVDSTPQAWVCDEVESSPY